MFPPLKMPKNAVNTWEKEKKGNYGGNVFNAGQICLASNKFKRVTCAAKFEDASLWGFISS